MTYKELFHEHMEPFLRNAQKPLTAVQICDALAITDSLVETVQVLRIGIKDKLIIKISGCFIHADNVGKFPTDNTPERHVPIKRVIRRKAERYPSNPRRGHLKPSRLDGKIAMCLFKNKDDVLSCREIKILTGIKSDINITHQLLELFKGGYVVRTKDPKRFSYKWSGKFDYPFQIMSMTDCDHLVMTKRQYDDQQERKEIDRQLMESSSTVLLADYTNRMASLSLVLSNLARDIRGGVFKSPREVVNTLESAISDLTKSTASVKSIMAQKGRANGQVGN